MSDVLFSPPPHHAESTENVAFKEEHRHLHLFWSVRGTFADAQRESWSNSGRTGRTVESETGHDLRLGTRPKCSTYRELSSYCRSIQNQASESDSSRKIKKLCFLHNLLLTFNYVDAIIKSVTLAVADSVNIFARPALRVNVTHEHAGRAFFMT